MTSDGEAKAANSATGDTPAAAPSSTAAAGSTALKPPAAGVPARPAPKPSAAPPPPREPYVPTPTQPISMIATPPDAAGDLPPAAPKHFAGEIDDDFESVLARVQPNPRRHPLLAQLGRALARLIPFSPRRPSKPAIDSSRHVAFDGFTSTLHEDKLERDRRYGTVYTVREERNAFLVRLELPRRVPESTLKHTWNVPDVMPDYDYAIDLAGGVLSIRAGVRGEALRRLSYVSSSFPSDFLTRIDLNGATGPFKHRMAAKVLEVIVLKGATDRLPDAA